MKNSNGTHKDVTRGDGFARVGRLLQSCLGCEQAYLNLAGEWLAILGHQDVHADELTGTWNRLDPDASSLVMAERQRSGDTQVGAVCVERRGDVAGRMLFEWPDNRDHDETLVLDVAQTVLDVLESGRYERRTRMLVDLVPHGIVVETANGERVLTNRAFEAYLDEASVAGVESLRDVIDIDIDNLSTDEVRREVQSVDTGGDVRTFEVAMRLYRDWQFGQDAIMAVMTDLTDIERSQEELRLKQRQLRAANVELERSNAELEQFAYIASHDLQEPLRMVSSFLSLLVEEYGHKLDENATEYIDFAVDGAQRMKSMVNDLLEFSRVRSSDAPVTRVDTGQVVEGVLSELRDNHALDDIGFVIEPLPEIAARESQLRRVFANLLVNAVRHAGRDDLTVTISAAERDVEWEFAVEDTGRGVPVQQQQRIFDLFIRGVRDDIDSTGTGIGLAVCATVVAHHGGRIWVENVEPHGARFKFTIAKELEHGNG
jgi:signal transduction histidine kinase